MNGGRSVAFFVYTGFINWRINYPTTVRLWSDGDIGYVGGFNVGDEYLGKRPAWCGVIRIFALPEMRSFIAIAILSHDWNAPRLEEKDVNLALSIAVN